jgi:hypothetical protein
VTVEWLKSLKATSNDPAGDGFTGSRDQLTRTVDAIVNDWRERQSGDHAGAGALHRGHQSP